jgi:hypothetical protein
MASKIAQPVHPQLCSSLNFTSWQQSYLRVPSSTILFVLSLC